MGQSDRVTTRVRPTFLLAFLVSFILGYFVRLDGVSPSIKRGDPAARGYAGQAAASRFAWLRGTRRTFPHSRSKRDKPRLPGDTPTFQLPDL
jgi:hypothetical protein